MDESYIFRKTDQGTGEVMLHASHLSPKHRRCLILIDGRRTVRDLAQCFRPGELRPLLKELVERGFVYPPPGGAETIDVAAADPPLIGLTRFREIRARAIREITQRLGTAGKPLADDIERCGSPEELRVALRTTERVLQAFLGADEARAFVKRVGKDLMGVEP